MSRPVAACAVVVVVLAACSPPAAPDPVPAPAPPPPAPLVPDDVAGPPPLVSNGDFDWPDSVAAFGAGYPKAGDPCRNLGEASATGEYLDHTLDLVGCPGGPETPAARALIAAGGHLNGQHDGVAMISMPRPPGSPE